MAIYNTPSDAANTAVRSFLTSVGEHYLVRPAKPCIAMREEDFMLDGGDMISRFCYLQR